MKNNVDSLPNPVAVLHVPGRGARNGTSLEITSQQPVICIVGTTGSGKSVLARFLAHQQLVSSPDAEVHFAMGLGFAPSGGDAVAPQNLCGLQENHLRENYPGQVHYHLFCGGEALPGEGAPAGSVIVLDELLFSMVEYIPDWAATAAARHHLLIVCAQHPADIFSGAVPDWVAGLFVGPVATKYLPEAIGRALLENKPSKSDAFAEFIYSSGSELRICRLYRPHLEKDLRNTIFNRSWLHKAMAAYLAVGVLTGTLLFIKDYRSLSAALLVTVLLLMGVHFGKLVRRNGLRNYFFNYYGTRQTKSFGQLAFIGLGIGFTFGIIPSHANSASELGFMLLGLVPIGVLSAYEYRKAIHLLAAA